METINQNKSINQIMGLANQYRCNARCQIRYTY